MNTQQRKHGVRVWVTIYSDLLVPVTTLLKSPGVYTCAPMCNVHTRVSVRRDTSVGTCVGSLCMYLCVCVGACVDLKGAVYLLHCRLILNHLSGVLHLLSSVENLGYQVCSPIPQRA